MNHRVALSHASGLTAEAILEKLPESGITPDSLVLLDTEANAGKRLGFGSGYIRTEAQETFDFSDFALLLMPESDPLLLAKVQEQGCVVVSHTSRDSGAAVFLEQANSTPDLTYSRSDIRLPGPEVSCLLPVLLELNRFQSLLKLNLTLVKSAEFRGKAGVDELASQTVNLLNARPVVPAVYPHQIAFNILPEFAEPRIEADLIEILGNDQFSCSTQALNVPVFHGFAAGVQIEFSSAINFDDCVAGLRGLQNLSLEEGQASPVSDCNQSFSCVISHLKQVSNQPSSLHFWMIADPMRYGLANNYVNVSDFLLKSFL